MFRCRVTAALERIIAKCKKCNECASSHECANLDVLNPPDNSADKLLLACRERYHNYDGIAEALKLLRHAETDDVALLIKKLFYVQKGVIL